MKQRPKKKPTFTRKQYVILAFCCLGASLGGTALFQGLRYLEIIPWSHPLVVEGEMAVYGIGFGFFWFLSFVFRDTRPTLSKFLSFFTRFGWGICIFMLVVIPIAWPYP